MENKPINIAFCFDEKLWMQAGVAITSLLCMSKEKCNYNIYCIVSSSVNQTMKNILELLVKRHSVLSSIKFLLVTDQLDAIASAKKSMYYRFLLCEMLPDVNKIIYADVDLIFNDDLQELNDINISKYYIAGVKDFYKNKENFRSKIWSEYGLYDISNKGQYINTGVLIINLKKLRQDNIDKKWFQLANISFPFHDQDIINLSCVGNILLLSDDYNFTGTGSRVLHYAGPNKPWDAYESTLRYSELWWYYAYQTPFHLHFLKNVMQKQYENMFKVLPRWLGRFFCWFIFKKESRHRFLNKYVKFHKYDY